MYLYFGLPYDNIIEGHSIGAEIAPNWRITPWWQVRGSYSYLHMSLRDDPGFTDVGNILETYLGASPGSVADVQLQFNLPKHFEFDPTYRYSGKLPEYTVPAYSTMDVRAGWSYREGFDFSIVGQNLLQPHHAESGGDPGALVGIKRAVYAKITWQR